MNEPTGYTALDLVGFTDKGNYSGSASYVKNDLVHYSGNIWRCLIDDTSGITPSESANWTIFIGEPTNLTEAIIAPIEQSPATAAHSVGDQLIYNDILYKVIAPIAVSDSLTVGTNIEAARKIVYQISGIESVIATIEPTTTASQNYAVGDYLFHEWKFYRVTTAISSGGTITTTGGSANVAETTIGAELVSQNSHIANLETADSNIKATMRSNGAHNLLPFDIAAIKALNTSGTWSGNVYTYAGLQITLYDDGSYDIHGTASANGAIKGLNFTMPTGDYTMSGATGGSLSSWYVALLNVTDSTNPANNVDGDTAISLNSSKKYQTLIYVIQGAVFNHQKFYPMIRSASDTDTNYAPYAMSNRELTKKFYTYSATVPAAGSAISLSLPYGTRDDWILSGTTLEYTPWGAAYDVYSAAIVFGVTTVLHNQYLEIGNGYTSGTHNKDAAGQNIRVLLVHK